MSYIVFKIKDKQITWKWEARISYGTGKSAATVSHADGFALVSRFWESIAAQFVLAAQRDCGEYVCVCTVPAHVIWRKEKCVTRKKVALALFRNRWLIAGMTDLHFAWVIAPGAKFKKLRISAVRCWLFVVCWSGPNRMLIGQRIHEFSTVVSKGTM